MGKRVCRCCGRVLFSQRRRRCKECGELCCHSCLNYEQIDEDICPRLCPRCARDSDQVYIPRAMSRVNPMFHDAGVWVCGGVWVWARKLTGGVASAPRLRFPRRRGFNRDDIERQYHGFREEEDYWCC